MDTKNILVVGDWIIDENWTVAPDYSDTSIEPLERYYRSIIGRKQSVYGLSGAGRVARALHWMNRWELDDKEEAVQANSQGPRFNVFGLGLWAETDDEILPRLFIPDITKSANPYQLRSKLFTDGDQYDTPQLWNLSGCVVAPNGDRSALSTFHSYHVFESTGKKLRLSLRIAWNYPEIDVDSRGHRVWRLERDRSGDLRDLIEGKRFDAVVVKCLGQGTVSEELVTLIGAAVGKVPWFVSSVLGTKATWLRFIPRSCLRLLYLPPSSLKESGVATWRAATGAISLGMPRSLLKAERGKAARLIMPRPWCSSVPRSPRARAREPRGADVP